ncbi:MAG: hypothetical protein JF606_17865 [Burkholderiales bacterium]|nr:hypothetical protein [Burkholderiales bacterium]
MKKADVKRTDLKRAEVQRTDLKRAEVQRTDVKRAHVKRTDVQLAYVQLAYVQFAYVQLAYVQLAYVQLTYVQLAYVQLAYVQLAYVQLAYVLADVERAKKKGTDVIVPNSRRPPGRGPLTLAKLLGDGHRLWFYFGCTFKSAFYGMRYVACVQNWNELDSHASDFPIHLAGTQWSRKRKAALASVGCAIPLQPSGIF